MDNDREVQMEVLKAQFQIDLEKYKLEYASNFESFKATIGYSNIAIQSLITISGGATIALAAFTGNIFSKGCVISKPSFFICFIAASVFACLCAAISYLAQSFFNNKKNKIGLCFQIAAIFVYLLGIISFSCGGYLVYKNVLSQQQICNENSKNYVNPFLVFPSQ